MNIDARILDAELERLGYTFLGWQNSWKSVYFDVNGDITEGNTSKGDMPARSFGYMKEDYPEYRHCVDSKHHTDTVRHDNKGFENTVSCDICKIYWKFDSSD